MTASAPAHFTRVSYASSAKTAPQTCYRVEILSSAEMRALDRDAWDRLARNTIEDNPFLSSRFTIAALDAYPELSQCAAVAVRSPDGRRLLGLFPFAPYQSALPLPAVAVQSTLHLYQVQGTPLISADHAAPVLKAFLNAIQETSTVCPRWVFPHVRLDGPFAKELAKAAREMGFETRALHGYDRSILTRNPEGFDAHVEAVIGKKRKKDIARNLRRLGAMGSVCFERATEPSLVAQRLEDFLRLERSGWKGEMGTALLSNPADAQFARAAFGQGAGAPIASMDSLLLDERVIASSLNIAVGDTLFTPKCAYDESFRKYGPGLALEFKVIEAFYADTTITGMDSATTVDGHVISGFWNGSVAMGTLVLGPRSALTGLVSGLVEGEANLRLMAKKVLRRGS